MKDLPFRLWRYLLANAVGRENAVRVPDIAGMLYVDEVKVREAARELNFECGLPVAATTHQPPGIFIFTTKAERFDYAESMRSRARKISQRARVIERIEPFDPAKTRFRSPAQGVQGELFAQGGGT